MTDEEKPENQEDENKKEDTLEKYKSQVTGLLGSLKGTVEKTVQDLKKPKESTQDSSEQPIENEPSETAEELKKEDTLQATKDSVMGLVGSLKGTVEKTVQDLTKKKTDEKPEEEAAEQPQEEQSATQAEEPVQAADDSPDEEQESATEDAENQAAPTTKDTVMGLVGSLKGTVEKTVQDLTQKKAAPPKGQESQAAPQPAKPPVDYAQLAKQGLSKTKKAFKEIAALAMDKDIPMDYSELENAELLSNDTFAQQISQMEEKLKAYHEVKDSEEKEQVAAARTACKQDNNMLKDMIKDLRMEMKLVYKSIQEQNELEAIEEKFNDVTDNKWRPLVQLKSLDTDGVICSPEEFDRQFEELIALNASILQVIHGQDDSEEMDTTDKE